LYVAHKDYIQKTMNFTQNNAHDADSAADVTLRSAQRTHCGMRMGVGSSKYMVRL